MQITFEPGAPVSAQWANQSHLDLFVTSRDGVVWSSGWDGNTGWQPWFTIHPEKQFKAGALVTALWANANHLDLFVSDANGVVWSTWWEADQGWQPWFAIHPETQFTPGSTVTALWANPQHLDLFVSDANGVVWSTWFELGQGYQPWFSIYPERTFHPGAPVTALWANPQHLDLFVSDANGVVWSTWYEANSGWQAWFPISAEPTLEPGTQVTALWATSNHLDLFGVGSDGVVISSWWEVDDGWQPWFEIEAATKFVPGAPVTALWANPGHLDLFVPGIDGQVRTIFYTDTVAPEWGLLANPDFSNEEVKSVYFFAGNWRCCKWQPWFTIHPQNLFEPGASVTALWANETHLDLFVTDRNGIVWSNWFEGNVGWQSWFEIDPETRFAPGAEVTARWANDRHLDLFVTDVDGVVWSTWWEFQQGWQPWFSIYPENTFQPGGTVTALWSNRAHLDLFVTSADGAVWSSWYEGDKGWQPWFPLYLDQKFQPGVPVTALWANAEHLDLFSSDTDGAVWSTWYEAAHGWQPWFPINAETRFQSGAPVTALWSNSDHLDLFISAQDGTVWSTWFEAAKGWQPWFPLHAETTLQPGTPLTAIRTTEVRLESPDNRLNLLATASDGAVWTSWHQADIGWEPWSPIYLEHPLAAGTRLNVVRSGKDHLDLFATGTDGAVWSTFAYASYHSQFYEYPAGPNEFLYTLHPSDARHLGWSEQQANRDFAIDTMLAAHVNVVSMSYWGPRGSGETNLNGSDTWRFWAPMHTSTKAHDQLFDAVVDKPILILPVIESADATMGCGGHSSAYHFASDFPGTPGNPAPELVKRIVDLVNRYLKNPAKPTWPASWAQLYDRDGVPRYAINILHVASNQLFPADDERFAQGFDAVANQIEQTPGVKGVKVGFTLDLLRLPRCVEMGSCPLKSCNEPNQLVDTFVATPELTGPYLRQQRSFLGVQAFIPEIWPREIQDDDALVNFKRKYLQDWLKQDVPVFLDVSPGYDAHILFPRVKRYGHDAAWREALTQLRTPDMKGMTFNSWNGYTEGYAAMPTVEYGDATYLWLQALYGQDIPQMQEQPTDSLVGVGRSAHLSVAALGDNVTYQWYEGLSGDTSHPIEAATNSNYVTPELTVTRTYWVRISNAAGSSDSATLTAQLVQTPYQMNRAPLRLEFR